jgi:hypothetical protein
MENNKGNMPEALLSVGILCTDLVYVLKMKFKSKVKQFLKQKTYSMQNNVTGCKAVEE